MSKLARSISLIIIVNNGGYLMSFILYNIRLLFNNSSLSDYSWIISLIAETFFSIAASSNAPIFTDYREAYIKEINNIKRLIKIIFFKQNVNIIPAVVVMANVNT
uniref:Oligosaccharide flippase family protein n=1 Tax=Meloidogyne hapla TaxID=6305 RepID=A0A1I8BX41_MELHA